MSAQQAAGAPASKPAGKAAGKAAGGKPAGGKPAAGKPAGKKGLAALADAAATPWWLIGARTVMVLAFAAAIPFILGVPLGMRLFWTAAIAVLPLFWVLGGYYLWRRLCPLAAFSQLGRVIGRPGTRKVTGWLADNYMLFQLGFMVVALSLRLTAINGTPWALAGFLAAVTLAAAVTGLVYTGKTWCNFFCPVGMVEKIYTEPSRLVGEDNSQCSPCTACKKHCPDIDLEQGYWKEVDGGARRTAYFAWPGLVLGFYTYYYLAAGSWDFYFSGDWTRQTDQIQQWLGPGFWFLPALPAVVAAPLTLLVFGAASAAVFSIGERLALRGKTEPEARRRVRHQALVLAGFLAFLLFYFFAGQPTLRAAPVWVQRGVAALVVVAASAIFFRRWPRREADFVQEKFARGILKRWEWGDAPPAERLQDIYLIHTERTKQRESRLRAYKETIRDLIGDGLVSRAELAVLDNLRGQLGIADKDHDKVLGELSAEERQLFDPAYHGSAEKRLQQQQYQRDLERAVMAAARAGGAADPATLEALRKEHDIPPAEHAAALARLLDASGPVRELVREELVHITALRAAAAATRAVVLQESAASSLGFVRFLCAWRARQRVEHALTTLRAVGDANRLDQARVRLLARDAQTRAEGAELLGKAVASDLGAPLAEAAQDLEGERLVGVPATSAPLLAVAADTSPHLRAAVATVLSRFDDEAARAQVARASEDPDPLVRESAFRALGARGRLKREMVARALNDPDERVRLAVVRGVGKTTAELPASDTGLARATDELDAADPGQYATLRADAAIETLTALEKMMLVRNVPMFQALEPDDLEEVSALASERRLLAGQTLFRQGDAGHEVYILVSGRVRAWTGGADGSAARVLGESAAGSCIGEMAVFGSAARSATVTALQDARLLVLGGAAFKSLLADRPGLAASIIDVLVGRMRGMIGGPAGDSPPAPTPG